MADTETLWQKIKDILDNEDIYPRKTLMCALIELVEAERKAAVKAALLKCCARIFMNHGIVCEKEAEYVLSEMFPPPPVGDSPL